jgi:hypothetical protein
MLGSKTEEIKTGLETWAKKGCGTEDQEPPGKGPEKKEIKVKNLGRMEAEVCRCGQVGGGEKGLPFTSGSLGHNARGVGMKTVQSHWGSSSEGPHVW